MTLLALVLIEWRLPSGSVAGEETDDRFIGDLRLIYGQISNQDESPVNKE